jgi:O-antigen/teichoic acid export membrane protein
VVPPAVTGDFAIVTVLLPLIDLLSAAGTTHVVAQRVAEGREEGTALDSVAGVVVWRLAVAAALVLISEALLPSLHLPPGLAYFIRVSELAWLAAALDLDWLFVALGHLDSSSYVRTLAAIARLALIVVMVPTAAQANRLPWALSISVVVGTLAAWVLAARNGTLAVIRRRAAGMLTVGPRLAAGAHFLLGDLSVFALTQADRFILYGLAGPQVTGLYHAAQRLVQPLYSIAAVVTSAWYRRLVTTFASAPSRPAASPALRETLGEYFWWMLALTAPAGAFTTLFAREIVAAAYGPAYAAAAPMLAIFGWVITFGYTNAAVILPFKAWKMPRAYGWSVGAAGATNVALCLALVPVWGGVGGAMAALAGKITATVVGYRAFVEVVRFPALHVYGGFLLATACAAVVGAVVRSRLGTLAGMAAFALAYAAVEAIRWRTGRTADARAAFRGPVA